MFGAALQQLRGKHSRDGGNGGSGDVDWVRLQSEHCRRVADEDSDGFSTKTVWTKRERAPPSWLLNAPRLVFCRIAIVDETQASRRKTTICNVLTRLDKLSYASANQPGGRGFGNSWVDASGNFFLFAGQGFDGVGAVGSLNDLWEYSPGSNQWRWMGGNNTVPAGNYGVYNGRTGSYGTEGAYAAGNIPPQSALAFSSASSANFVEGVSSSFTFNAVGSPTPTYTENGTLPTGVTFDATGVLSDIPASGSAGSYPLTVTASNGLSASATQSFTLTVSGPQPVATTTSISPAMTNVVVGTPLRLPTRGVIAAMEVSGLLPPEP